VTRSARIVPVVDLSEGQRTAMLMLMREHYVGVEADVFAADLAAKRWAILMEDDQRLYGFSTQVPFTVSVAGVSHRLVFSGDTIISRDAWGGLELPIAWGCLMRALRASAPDPLYWFLLSKGYKTYRFLPVFFRQYIPSRHGDEEGLSPVLAAAAAALFPGRWDGTAGIIRAVPGGPHVRPGLADVDERAANLDVAFFARSNPRHAMGDELACLARFDEDNLRPFIRRQLDAAHITLPPLP
jgi:hypothetical protein